MKTTPAFLKVPAVALHVGLVVLAALCLRDSGNVYGALVYEDTFSADPGPLNGRTTAPGFGNWTTLTGRFRSVAVKLRSTQTHLSTTTQRPLRFPH